MRNLLVFILLFCCSCLSATPAEYENVVSPDGKYQFSYLTNGNTVKGMPGGDKNDYNLHIIDVKTKKDKAVIKSINMVDGITWSPDSKWLVIHQSLRQMALLSLLEVKSRKKIDVDYWRYISDHAKEHGLMLPPGAPFPGIELGSWAKDGRTVEMKYSFVNGEEMYSGTLTYDLRKLCITKLIPGMAE